MTRLQIASPEAAAGLARVGELIDSDGALSSGEKCLIAAGVAAVKRMPGESALYIGKALERGITTDQVDGVAASVLVSRGIEPYRIISGALKSAAARAGEPPPLLDLSSILDYFEKLYQSVPDHVELAARHAPAMLDAYYLMRTAAIDHSSIDPMLADLMMCAFNASEHQVAFIEIHARFALDRGASIAQLVEAVACVTPFAGVAAWLSGANAILRVMAERGLV